MDTNTDPRPFPRYSEWMRNFTGTTTECNYCGGVFVPTAAPVDALDASEAVGEWVCGTCAAVVLAEVKQLEADEHVPPTTAADLVAQLLCLVNAGLGDADVSDWFGSVVASADTYAEAGMLTRDDGVVLRFTNGVELAVTITKTRNSR